ncbi:Multidrug resistance protein 1 [Entamoeba marina]
MNVDMSDDLFIFDVTPDPNELNIKNQKLNERGKVNLFKFFRYCSFIDCTLLLFGVIGSIAVGALNPLLMLLIGQMVDTFTPNSTDFGSTNSIGSGSSESFINEQIINEISDVTNELVIKMTLFSLGNMIAGFICTFSFFVLSQRQGIKIRSLYFKALLRQDMSWFDLHESGEFTARIAADVQRIQDGMSFKFGVIFQTISSFITGYTIGFVLCWDLTLVILCVMPFIFISIMGLGMSAGIFTKKSMVPFGEAGVIAEEVVGNIRTVQSLNQQQYFCEKYNNKIKETDKYHVRRGIGIGSGLGSMMFFLLSSNALGCWYGIYLVRGKGISDDITAGTVMIVFLSVLMATQNLSRISTPMNVLATAKAAAYRIYQTIDRIPEIDSYSIAGLKPNDCNGSIEFEGVQFSYPTRFTTTILNGLNLQIDCGKTIALVGASGCGKSTIIQLIQRMYNSTGGRILLDGNDIKNLNISWLRNQIGVVGQEPVLFSCSIKDNILLGGIDNQLITEDDIINAAKMANAHDFITTMPEGYNTLVGERGAQLSGGQKQRIAIARALIRNPKILLLDEATSALDNQSEKIVQDALEKASKDRTTIIIAHRLSTIQNVDKIYVFHQGNLIESGNHNELINKKGTYYSLVQHQNIEESGDVEQNNQIESQPHENNNDTDLKFNESFNTLNDTSLNEDINNELIHDETTIKKSSNIKVLFRVVMNNFTNEWCLCSLGLLGGICAGAAFPFVSLQFINLIIVMMQLQPNVDLTDDQRTTIIQSCLIIIGFGILTMVSFFCYVGLFIAAGEKMIGRIRRRFFKAIVRQNISYFDMKENMVGSITTKLSSDPTTLNGISAERIGDIIEIISTVCFGFGIAFYFDYKVALCVAGVFPILAIFLFVNGKFNSANAAPATSAYERSGVTLVEAIESIKTVQYLSKETHFHNKFTMDLKIPKRGIWKWGPALSITNAITNLISFGIQAYGYYLGIYFLKKQIDYSLSVNIFLLTLITEFGAIQKALNATLNASTSFAQLGNVVPDVGQAVHAARNIFQVIDRKPSIDCYSNDGKVIDDFVGDVEFKNISFNYPTRPNHSVLTNFSLKASQGKTIALVGASGCGKSTTIQLLQRFYQQTSGKILVGGVDIRELNISWLRNQIGVVGQEPILFGESIVDNIKKGCCSDDNISMERVYTAAKMANAHDFITTMPEGYNTLVGERGAQLSGGQKQRIAIARALIRNPKILLLDEATSALDSESEKIVQDALEKASKGRTTIIIAHRLSTIQNADEICVILKGKVVERGTHQELLALNGYYTQLTQQLSNPN